MACEQHGLVYVEFGGNTGSPPEGYCYQCEIDRLAAALAEAQRHTDWQAQKIVSLQDKVDGFAGVYAELAECQESLAKWKQIAENRRVDGRKAWDEVDRLKAWIDEMIDAQKWEVPK